MNLTERVPISVMTMFLRALPLPEFRYQDREHQVPAGSGFAPGSRVLLRRVGVVHDCLLSCSLR